MFIAYKYILQIYQIFQWFYDFKFHRNQLICILSLYKVIMNDYIEQLKLKLNITNKDLKTF